LATAKRDAAKRGLYSKFFRGPVLGPNTIIEEEEKHLVALVSQTFSENDSRVEAVSVQETIEIQTADENVRVDLEVSKFLKKKRKTRESKDRETDEDEDEDEDKAAKRERKRRRKEKKEKKAESHATAKRHKKEKHKEDTEANSCTLSKPSPLPISQENRKIEDATAIKNTTDDHESQADHKRRKKEEKRRKKKWKHPDAE